MPLIRYEVGDRGALAPEGETCACGRTLPILKCIEGRLDDIITTPDGRKIGRLDTVFKADLPIREAQIIQVSLDELLIKVVAASGFNSGTRVEISKRLRERVGNMYIRIERVRGIPRGSNGKFHAVISKIATNSVSSGISPTGSTRGER